MSLLLRRLAIPAILLICLVMFPANGATIGFSEVVGNSLCHDTDPVNSPNAGLNNGEPFNIQKWVLNMSTFDWKKYHVRLQTLVNDEWQDSVEMDGISFNQPSPFADWVLGVEVKGNMTSYLYGDDWDVVRTNVPLDKLDFVFKTFEIMPGDTLYLGFTMTDFGQNNTWRLCQRADVPEPSTLAMVLLGALGLGIGWKRR
jgi:hypothetical protein